MSDAETQKLRTLNALEVLSPDQLRNLSKRIQESGILGRSRTYAALLDYLVECSIEDRQPKEIEIALDVLGRPSDFDPSQDSSVRVSIHQLRKKLDAYYTTHETTAHYRIIIPKGQYGIGVETVPQADATSSNRPTRRLERFGILLPFVLAILLAGNLWFMTRGVLLTGAPEDDPITSYPVWSALLDDEIPILLVLGDFYIFGELDNSGNIKRMIREFDINSRQDLEDRMTIPDENHEKYINLDLNYLPEGSGYALARIAPILYRTGKRVSVVMMSDLSTSDLRRNHIVYLGYISALDKLTDLTFAASGLKLDNNYNELQNVADQTLYSSSAGLPKAGERFRDYGLLSTYSTSRDTKVVVIAGMWDAGLMHIAQVLTDPQGLEELHSRAAIDGGTNPMNFEALYEVFGKDRLNFTANLVYSGHVDSELIWKASDIED